MKEKQKTICPLSPSPSTYDVLLEEFLPVIHKAAYSIQKGRGMNDAPKELLLAGLKGFNDAFLNFCEATSHNPKAIFLNTICCAMRQQLKSDPAHVSF